MQVDRGLMRSKTDAILEIFPHKIINYQGPLVILWCRNLAELSRFTWSSGVKRWHLVPSDAPSQAQLCPGTFPPSSMSSIWWRTQGEDPPSECEAWHLWNCGGHERQGTMEELFQIGRDWEDLRTKGNMWFPSPAASGNLLGMQSSTSTHTSDLRNQKLHFSKIPMMPVHI